MTRVCQLVRKPHGAQCLSVTGFKYIFLPPSYLCLFNISNYIQLPPHIDLMGPSPPNSQILCKISKYSGLLRFAALPCETRHTVKLNLISPSVRPSRLPLSHGVFQNFRCQSVPNFPF